MEEWTNFNSVEHEVAPGEAHNRLALVERRHAVLRKAIEIYMEDMKLDDQQGIRKALTLDLCAAPGELNSFYGWMQSEPMVPMVTREADTSSWRTHP